MDAELGMREESGGPIDFVPGSPQTAVADKESVVFRVGDLYLSTDSVDLKRSSFVLRSHPAADYIRVELVPGAALPDWTFTDLSGVQGSLKSYAGKYVLLDFWTSWCAPCRADFEDLKVVLHRFQSRNFEVLGVLSDTDEAAARKLAQERNLPWPTAASPATLDYAMKRLRVSIFPTHILLDPNGHVVSASDTAVRGEALSKTLEALLPR
ncbi:MAG TPA: TlpA disulfide reductase family protein [Bryobacteraceae bacterium]